MQEPVPYRVEPPEFPEILVLRVWVALCERLHDPVRVLAEPKGGRTVEVLGVLRYLVFPTARRVHFSYAVGRRRFVTGAMDGWVGIDPALVGDLWLAHFAANWLINAGHLPLPPAERGGRAEAFGELIKRLRDSRAFALLRDRVRACRVEGPLRDRIAEALALDRRVIAFACMGIPRGELAIISSHEYSAAWRNVDDLEQLERENPALLRPFAGAMLAGALGRHADPARDLKLAFRARGVTDAGWKLLANSEPGYFDSALANAANENVFEVYCWLLKACTAAGGLLPKAVLQRLVLPNGREPGRPVLLDPSVLESGFWMPFFRALGRRLASLDTRTEVRAFLEGEFEDVYDWLEWDEPEIDSNQANAGWAWMLKQHRAWQEREREAALARREELRWEAPVPAFGSGPWRVTALLDSFELWEEGHALRHCVRTYAENCKSGRGLVFSIRKATGERVATGHLDLRRFPWRVTSVRTFANRPARPELVEVALAYAEACNAAERGRRDRQLQVA